MIDFVSFLQRRVYHPVAIDDHFVLGALADTVSDARYHHPSVTVQEVERNIQSGQNALPVFLFRLGHALQRSGGATGALDQVHWLLRDLCACEIYFNNVIGVGFRVVHGEGTVIGSRNTIGRGFTIHHGCTVGHRSNGVGAGSRIGGDVTLYANSSVVGEISIGDGAIIGAGLTITRDVPAGAVKTVNRPPE